MDFGEVLGGAWKIIWRFKILWLFGILASCGSNGANPNPTLNYSYDYEEVPLRIQAFFEQFTTAQWVALASALAIFILLLIILATFCNVIGRAGLIRGTQEADDGAERLPFGALLQHSLPFFWRLLGLALLVGFTILLIVFAATALVVTGAVLTFGLLLICLIPLLCLIIPLAFFVNIVIEQSGIAIVVDNIGVFDGLRRGWEVTRGNLGSLILMGLVLYIGIGGIGGFLIALPLMLTMAPLFYGLFANNSQTLHTSLIATGVCAAAYLPVLILLSGILKSYITSAWTLTYLRLRTV